MTYDEAVVELKNLYHRTRVTKDIYVPAEVITAILGYPSRQLYYEDYKKE